MIAIVRLLAELLAPEGDGGRDGGRPAAAGTRLCTCGHPRAAHEHYRRGSDCALCSCPRYHRPLLSRLPFARQPRPRA